MRRILNFLTRLPVHLIIIAMVIIWIVPTLGTFVSSFRSRAAVQSSGWWTAFSPAAVAGSTEYLQACASCHGADGKGVATKDLTDPAISSQYTASNRLLALLRQPINNGPHVTDPTWGPLVSDPTRTREALEKLRPISAYLGRLAGGQVAGAGLTTSNYMDALVGYKGATTYQQDCAAGKSESGKYYCNARDLLSEEGMARAFLNSMLVSVPATLLPIIIGAFAAYAFAWMAFRGRLALFVLLVGLQIVPLQMTLVPIARLYARLGLQSTFLGIWLFHTGFGLPYAIFLLRNALGGLPRDLFESAYLDGANHWVAFRRLAIPLALPAIASLAIFQFLWVWNDLLVAIILLPSHPVLTYQITNLIDPRGGNWHLLTAAAFLSMILPMIVFLSFQRYFVRGMTAGAVKG